MDENVEEYEGTIDESAPYRMYNFQDSTSGEKVLHQWSSSLQKLLNRVADRFTRVFDTSHS